MAARNRIRSLTCFSNAFRFVGPFWDTLASTGAYFARGPLYAGPGLKPSNVSNNPYCTRLEREMGLPKSSSLTLTFLYSGDFSFAFNSLPMRLAQVNLWVMSPVTVARSHKSPGLIFFWL